MEGLLSEVTRNARHANRRISVFGEMVALLWNGEKPEAAIRLEQLWNGLIQKYQFALLCGYPIKSFAGEGIESAIRKICERALPRSVL
jgi:hypothetical protein